MLTIRKMAETEHRMVVELWHATKKQAYPYLPLEQARTLEDDLEFFQRRLIPTCDIWVAEEGGRVVGFLAIQSSYIDRLYVLPGVQRLGIGSALIRRAMELSPAGLELHTHQKNLAACRFYERQGFRAVKSGTSPAPESEPDVEYHWRPEEGQGSLLKKETS
jgi:ribosomal protein S18 acetylase RimI-like enzyme